MTAGTGAPAAVAPAGSKAGRRATIAVVVIIGGILALNLLASGIDRAVGGSEPSGVSGSAYGTQNTGLAAASALFLHYGHPVSNQRGSLATATLTPTETVFVIEPQTLTADDDAALLEFVTRGGRLVIGGSEPFYLRNFRDHPPVWTTGGATAYNDIDPAFGSGAVVAAANGSWSKPGSGTVLVHTGAAALLTSDRAGRGTILFLADASPVENAYLGQADDAAFALGLAGPADRPVVFAEGTHGYGTSRGLSAIPTPWKVALLILTGAAIVLAWSRARRLGAPDREARELPPARGEYVRALAVSLERARDPEHALAPMQQWARAHVARRTHLPNDASLETIDRAAITLGCSESERAAMWYPPTDDASALALGRLVARLSNDERSRA